VERRISCATVSCIIPLALSRREGHGTTGQVENTAAPPFWDDLGGAAATPVEVPADEELDDVDF
jgi:hypothetical protein